MRTKAIRWFANRAVLAAAMYAVCAPLSGACQAAYHNIINQRFRTVGNGPQSALIVDVAADSDAATVRAAVAKSYSAMRRSRDPIMQRELAVMRRNREIKPGRQLNVVDIAIVRRGGVLPTKAAPRRASGNSLTFSFPTSGTDSWSVAKAAQLATLTGGTGLYGELTNVLGAPAWTGTVTVLNKDPYLGTVNEILGALFMFDPSTSGYEIWLPSFNDGQTEFLAMAQTMAQAWHGPDLIGYDAWEKGMARAVAIIAANDLKTYPGTTTTIDPSNGFYYTPDYDILNEPALGNNTFTPPTKGAQPGPTVDPTQFGGMMIPRLQMSGSAWLKCYIENPSFFLNFNTAYYTAFAADATIANDVNRLRELAATALPNVEGQPFDAWYEQQYVLDTSITVGTKLYAHTSATFPDSTSPAGAAVFLIYYQTTSTGDELDLNGISQVIYWDYTFSNRLALPSFETVTIADGFGAVAPYFQGIGNGDMMRVAMDFPVNKEYVRVYFPAGETGTDTAPNSFSGIVTGQDSGGLTAQFVGGGGIFNATAGVSGGSFGNNGTVGTGFSRVTLTLSLTGTPTLTFKRNVYIDTGNVTPIFQLAALGNTATLMNSFGNGAQMVSLPIRPLNTDMAVVMGATPSTALIAQFREDNTIGPDQYLRYPMLPAYQPGYGLWTDFPSVQTPTNGIVGVPYDPVSQPNVSIGLQFGWNQIGPPYNLPMNVTSDVQFQYLGGTPDDYQDAISAGWIAEGIQGYTPSTGYEDITNPTDPTIFPTNLLEPWQGYWIRVTVPEGVTMTFLSPAGRAARVSKALQKGNNLQGSWRLPLQLTDSTSHRSTATIGQAQTATTTFKTALDISSPPVAPGGYPLSLRLAAKQGDPVNKGAPGDLMADIRPMNGAVQWDLAAMLPAGKQIYTLRWTNTALLPHGTRLTLVDTTNNTRVTMNTGTEYTFQTAANETSRAFQVIAEPRSIGRLHISNIVAATPRGAPGRAISAMTISYELSAEGQTTASISMNGRVIRHLAQSGRAVSAGVNQLVWDLKDDKGHGVGGGTYMLQITAQTTDGEQTRSIVPLNIVR